MKIFFLVVFCIAVLALQAEGRRSQRCKNGQCITRRQTLPPTKICGNCTFDLTRCNLRRMQTIQISRGRKFLVSECFFKYLTCLYPNSFYEGKRRGIDCPKCKPRLRGCNFRKKICIQIKNRERYFITECFFKFLSCFAPTQMVRCQPTVTTTASPETTAAGTTTPETTAITAAPTTAAPTTAAATTEAATTTAATTTAATTEATTTIDG